MTKQRERPNIVVFFTDQQRWDTVGAQGNPLGLTPNFDRLAAEGTHFANAFTCQPVCGPARSCLQTGQYATTTGCYRNGIALSDHAKTMAHYLGEAGYQTGYIGKWHLADSDPVAPSQQGGYQYWLAANALEFTSDAYRTEVFNQQGESVFLPGYRVDALTDAAIRFIDDSNRREHPFFLFLSFLEPHHQNHRDDYPAPDGYADRYGRGWIPPDLDTLGGSARAHLPGYLGMVKRLDEALGRVLDALKSLGISDNTIVLFTSDHGNHFKTRNDEYKRSCHDGSVHVPMAASGWKFKGGGRVQELVSLVDIAPTLLEAAGLPVPDTMQGQSWLPLVERKPCEWRKEVFIQISESQIGRSIRTHRWKYAVRAEAGINLNQPGADRYQEDCLYDLMADRYELSNLIGYESHSGVAAHLRQRLLAWMHEVGEPEPEIVLAASKKSGQRRVLEKEIVQ